MYRVISLIGISLSEGSRRVSSKVSAGGSLALASWWNYLGIRFSADLVSLYDAAGGVYHGRMIVSTCSLSYARNNLTLITDSNFAVISPSFLSQLPSEYPFKPPEIYLLTPSGRFEVNRKICLSISSFHPQVRRSLARSAPKRTSG